MEVFLDWIRQPWPWYVAGPIVGLTVPVLLLLGNKSFGISSSLRHICAACVPAKIPFFTYDWKKEMWNFYFVTGVLFGGIIATVFLSNPNEMIIAESTRQDLAALGLSFDGSLMPMEIFTWDSLFSLKGLFFFVIGGFLVGFGTRYAGGCTSGHAIMGLSNLQWPSLVATCCFMVGGFVMTWLIFPYIMSIVGF